MRALRVPALRSWRFEVRCGDDGIGVNAAAVDRRLGALGELPEHDGAQRGLFGRGLRDVWLAQGAGRIEGVRDGRQVESWFFPARGDDPYAYLHVTDQPSPARPGSVVTVPLGSERLPADGRLRTLVSQLVQLRPVLEVEVAANAVYSWAAQQILARRLHEERPGDPIEYATGVYHEAQALRYRAHEKLMRAFLDEEGFDGQGRVGAEPGRRRPAQASLLEGR